MSIWDKIAFIFDMDGTLVDSEPMGPKTFKEFFASKGHKPTEEETSLFSSSWHMVGDYIPQDELLQEIARRYAITGDVLDEFYKLYEHNLNNAPQLSGVDNVIKRAIESNKKLAIVTASPRYQVEIVLKNNGWSEYFDVIVSGDDIKAHKPDPEGYNLAMSKLNVLPEDSVIFEDSKKGVKAGINAGVYTIGVKVGSMQKDDIDEASLVVELMDDLL